MTETKKCWIFKSILTIDKFWINNSVKIGRCAYCKTCDKAYKRGLYALAKERDAIHLRLALQMD